MRGVSARFLLPPALAVGVAALGALVGQVWIGLALGAVLGCALALLLAAHLRAKLLHIRAAVVSGLVRPGAAEHLDELDAVADAVERYVHAATSRRRGDLEELEHQVFVLDRMNDGLLRVAANGRVRYANGAAGSFFGGRNPVGQSFLRATRDHELHQALLACLTSGQDQQLALEQPEASRLVSAIIVRVDDDPPEALVMLRDITEVNRLQNLRRDFVANVSHELRTPLATIKILAETLLDLRPDDEEAGRYLTKLDGEIDVMTALVRDLLELSRLESQAGALTLGSTNAATIVTEVRERMLAIAQRREVALHIDLEHVDIPLVADERRLQQALVNLVGNAITHTPAGGAVTISVREERDHVTFAVRDSGHGIAEEDLPRVWERFFKADRSRTESGAGLGLAIVKHIVLAHGGTVSASSTVGEGSEFRMTIPSMAR